GGGRYLNMKESYGRSRGRGGGSGGQDIIDALGRLLEDTTHGQKAASVVVHTSCLRCGCHGVTLILLFGELLDHLLGHEHVALFRRAELKTLVNFHGNETIHLPPLHFVALRQPRDEMAWKPMKVIDDTSRPSVSLLSEASSSTSGH
ncbi:hypothetical protein Tco_0713616, partial [Tanacetum coccineum]